MNSHQLESLLHRLLGDVFCRVWAWDRLPLLNHSFRCPAYFIVNTHKGHRPWAHWLAMMLEEDSIATFFDSYGLPLDFAHYPPRHSTVFGKSRRDKEHPQPSAPTSTVRHEQSALHLLSLSSGLRIIFWTSTVFVDEDVIKNDLKVYNFVKKYHRIRNHNSFGQVACSLQMFRDCYHL